MTPPPNDGRVSDGVLLWPFGEGAVAVDLLTGTAHLLGPGAAWLLAHAGEPVELLLVDGADSATSVQHDELVGRIEEIRAELRAAGLLGRRDAAPAKARPVGSVHPSPGRHVGLAHPVLAERIAFRSDDADLLARIDGFLGSGAEPGRESDPEPHPDPEPEPHPDLDRKRDPDREPGTASRRPGAGTPAVAASATLFFDVVPHDRGGCRRGLELFTESEWRFESIAQFFFQLPAVLNDYALRSHDVLALHAGAVRTPDGRVVVLVGEMDAGKSTLTAALVAAGCDYLTDETVGVAPDLSLVGYPKPITLDPAAHRLLGVPDGDTPHLAPEVLRAGVERLSAASRPDEVLVVRFDPSAESTAESTTEPSVESRAGSAVVAGGDATSLDGPASPRDPGSPRTARLGATGGTTGGTIARLAVRRERLAPVAALEALCAHTLNLERIGEAGLAVLCDMAERVPVSTFTHPGIRVAVPAILGP